MEPAMHYSPGCYLSGLTVSENELSFRYAARWNTRADLPPTLPTALAMPEIAALVEALKPLAAMAERYDPDDGDGSYECWSGHAVPKIHHLRTARAALAAVKGAGG